MKNKKTISIALVVALVVGFFMLRNKKPDIKEVKVIPVSDWRIEQSPQLPRVLATVQKGSTLGRLAAQRGLQTLEALHEMVQFNRFDKDGKTPHHKGLSVVDLAGNIYDDKNFKTLGFTTQLKSGSLTIRNPIKYATVDAGKWQIKREGEIWASATIKEDKTTLKALAKKCSLEKSYFYDTKINRKISVRDIYGNYFDKSNIDDLQYKALIKKAEVEVPNVLLFFQGDPKLYIGDFSLNTPNSIAFDGLAWKVEKHCENVGVYFKKYKSPSIPKDITALLSNPSTVTGVFIGHGHDLGVKLTEEIQLNDSDVSQMKFKIPNLIVFACDNHKNHFWWDCAKNVFVPSFKYAMPGIIPLRNLRGGDNKSSWNSVLDSFHN